MKKLPLTLAERVLHKRAILERDRLARAAIKADPIRYAKYLARGKAYRDANKDRYAEHARRRSDRRKNDSVFREQCKAKERKYDIAHGRERSVTQMQLMRRLRARALSHLGGVCAVCRFSDHRALQFDHVRGGGTAERVKLKRSQYAIYKQVLADVTGKFQLLCANCNWIKRHDNDEFSRVYAKP